jgi:hypothetical protein
VRRRLSATPPRAAGLALALAALLAGSPAAAQTRRPPPKAPLLRTAPAEMTCQAPLGVGVRTARLFCDVLAGRDATGGILVKIPKHQGQATLTFDLHNRHTYSAEQVASGRAYVRYTATIGVLTLDNTLLSRFVVRNEFRREGDLFDRIGGGSGPGGVKAVAPTGVEPVLIQLPAGTETVSILGEKVATVKAEGEVLYSTPGRPIAIISQPMVEFRPPATTKPAAKKKPKR